MHVTRARDQCTSYATENTDYLTEIAMAVAYCWNSLLIKFLLASWVIYLGGPTYILIQQVRKMSQVYFIDIFYN